MMNKKGLVGWMVSIFWVFLTVAVIIGVLTINSVISKKMDSITQLSGVTAMGLFRTDETVQSTLLYVDVAAIEALVDAKKEVSKSGGLQSNPCGTITKETITYSLWKNSDRDCTAQNADILQSYEFFLNKYLDEYLAKYESSIRLPKQNYRLMIDGSRMYGIAKEKATGNYMIEDEVRGTFAFDPSFAISAGEDISASWTLIRAQVRASERLWAECMQEGSRTSTDADDATTCKAASGSIITESLFDDSRNQYLVYIKVPDPQRNGNDVNIALAINDNIPPPAFTTNEIRSQVQDGKTKIVWDKSKASDVAKYEVFYKKEFDYTSTGEAQLYASTSNEELELTGLESGVYFFSVVAVDKHDNRIARVVTSRVAI